MKRDISSQAAISKGAIVLTRTETFTPENEMEAVGMLRDINSELDKFKRQRAELNIRIEEMESEKNQLESMIKQLYPPKTDSPTT